MKPNAVWTRALFPVGLAAVLVGTLDPLEGSLLIVTGFGVLTFDAALTHSKVRPLMNWAFALVVVGVVALWILSSLGGIRVGGGTGGVSGWWGVLMLPYPLGWLAGLVAIWRTFADRRRMANTGAPSVR